MYMYFDKFSQKMLIQACIRYFYVIFCVRLFHIIQLLDIYYSFNGRELLLLASSADVSLA